MRETETATFGEIFVAKHLHEYYEEKRDWVNFIKIDMTVTARRQKIKHEDIRIDVRINSRGHYVILMEMEGIRTMGELREFSMYEYQKLHNIMIRQHNQTVERLNKENYIKT